MLDGSVFALISSHPSSRIDTETVTAT